MKKVSIVGILNITPDSFSDGGIYFSNPNKAVKKAKQMLEDGANIIDIGGESTRPGSKNISTDEELSRVIPVLDAIRKKLGNDFLISIDTFKAAVAAKALEHGANMVNSMGGMMFDPRMGTIIKKYNCPFIIYHIKGNPTTMQKGKIIYKNVIRDITKFFKEQIKLGMSVGINKKQFILDPGIGFGKTVDQNIEIIKRLSEFKTLHLPIMIGVSRKNHLGEILKSELDLEKIPKPKERLEASLAETAIAVLNGATFVRTHDVLQTKKFLAVFERIKSV